MTETECVKLFDDWSRAVSSGDPDAVLALYAPDAVLIPTLSNRVRSTPEAIRDYFVHFAGRRPVGRLEEHHVRLFEGFAVNSGRYAFTFPDGEVVHARYTFLYRREGGRWLIIEHHSSLLPEGGSEGETGRSRPEGVSPSA